MFYKKKDKEYLSHSLDETSKIGKDIFNIINKYAINNIFLIGDLGVGKTTLIKKILINFSISENEVTSPSFGTKNIYEANDIIFYHYDLYLSKKENITFMNFLDEDIKSNSIVFVEWSDKIKKLSTLKNSMKIIMKKTNNDFVYIKVEVK